MQETQCCYVCGQWDRLVVERVRVKADADSSDRVVVQCPRCFRFICSNHSEKLDVSKSRRWWRFGHRQKLLTLCCPFDPGVSLGNGEDGED